MFKQISSCLIVTAIVFSLLTAPILYARHHHGGDIAVGTGVGLMTGMVMASALSSNRDSTDTKILRDRLNSVVDELNRIENKLNQIEVRVDNLYAKK